MRRTHLLCEIIKLFSAPVCDIMFARFYEMKLNCKYKFCNKIILNFVFIIQILYKLVYYYF